MRDTQMNLRLSDEERDRMQRVADHYGVNVPNLIRMLVKREEAAIGAAAPPAMSGPSAPVKAPSLIEGHARDQAVKGKKRK